MMRKILRENKRYLLLLLLVINFIAFPLYDCYAIDDVNKLVLVCDEKVEVGGNITCQVSANFTTVNVRGISAKFDFSSNLDYVSFVHENHFDSYYQGNGGFLLVSNGSNLNKDLKIGTLTLKLNDVDNARNDCTVEINNIEISDTTEGYESKTLDSVESNIKIIRKQTEEKEPEEDDKKKEDGLFSGIVGKIILFISFILVAVLISFIIIKNNSKTKNNPNNMNNAINPNNMNNAINPNNMNNVINPNNPSNQNNQNNDGNQNN